MKNIFYGIHQRTTRILSKNKRYEYKCQTKSKSTSEKYPTWNVQTQNMNKDLSISKMPQLIGYESSYRTFHESLDYSVITQSIYHKI